MRRRVFSKICLTNRYGMKSPTTTTDSTTPTAATCNSEDLTRTGQFVLFIAVKQYPNLLYTAKLHCIEPQGQAILIRRAELILLRNICSVFDAYLGERAQVRNFSKAV